MSWNKFDSLDCSTWPPANEEVLWEVKINQVYHDDRFIFLGPLKITSDGRPAIYDPGLSEPYARYLGGDRFLDKNTENVFWMKIPEVNQKPLTEALINPDDTFNF